MSGVPYGPESRRLAALSPGNSILRVRFGFKADGFWTNPGAGTQTEIMASFSNTTSFGLVTTIGNGTETVPSPVLHPGDAAPPTQRWIYLATNSMSFIDMSGTSSTWPVGFSSPFMDVQSEAQVLATGFSSPETLNLWLAFDTQSGAWSTPTAGDEAWYTAWWSVLLKE